MLGFLWLIVWRWLYHSPESHPRISETERQLIIADKLESQPHSDNRNPLGWRILLGLPQTWGTIIAKALTDPVWFFVTDWFPIYLVAKGIELKSGLIAIWIPFLAADLGNFFGGGISGYLMKHGWSLGSARKAVVVFGGLGVTMLIPTVFTTNLYLIAFLFAFATFAYAAFSTMANVLPSDLFHSESVATVSGLSGTGAGLGTIVAFKLIGHFSDSRQAMAGHSFDPIVIVAGFVPLVGMILVLLLVRNTEATERGLVRPI
jgi:ACS family hexuronate transporter-like MFS transporter